MENDLYFERQMARWSILGRLTASLFHEINNPMQAIRGAMSLALEELDDPDALKTYVNMAQEESIRVLDLVALARRVYSPERVQPGQLDLNYLVQECLILTKKEMQRKNVDVATCFDAGLQPFMGTFHELSLALLCPMIEMSDKIAAEAGGGEIKITTEAKENSVLITLVTDGVSLPPGGFRLIVCRHVVESYQGKLVQYEENRKTTVKIELPTGN